MSTYDQNSYLKALSKALKSLDSTSRKNILAEIESLISADESGRSLVERFGTPEQLAAQYLDGSTPLPPSSGFKRWGKRFFATVGVVLLTLIGIMAFFAWYQTRDEFDYANLDHPTLSVENKEWTNSEGVPGALNIYQSKTVVYWHNQPQTRWRCKRPEPLEIDTNGVLNIKQNNCLVFLPYKTTDLNARQSRVVVVNPVQATSVNLYQTGLSLALAPESSVNIVSQTESKIDALTHSGRTQETGGSGIVITLKATQSKVKPYEY